MCRKKKCCNIEIIEIHNGIKVVLHYDKDGIPFFIQYWNDNKNINKSFKPIKQIGRDLDLEEIIKAEVIDLGNCNIDELEQYLGR